MRELTLYLITLSWIGKYVVDQAADSTAFRHPIMLRETPFVMSISSTPKAAAILAGMMFLLAAVGVPSEFMLQDTLKSAIAAFGVLGAALVFFWDQRERNTPLHWHGLMWLPLVLMAYALGSMLWSHTYLAGVEAIRWFLFALLLWLGLNVLTRKTIPWVIWGIHLGAVMAALWAAMQFWLDLDFFAQSRFPGSTFANRNFFAEYLVCTLPFSLYLLVGLRRSALRLPAMAASLCLNCVALMMTGTRSTLMAMAVVFPVLVLIVYRYRGQLACAQWSRLDKTVVAAVLLVGVGVLGSVPSGSDKVLAEGRGSTPLERSYLRTVSMLDTKEYSERSFYTRSLMWKASARLLQANLWTGVGAGAWEVQIPRYQRVADTMETDYYPHNEFLQMLCEYGAVAGGLVLAVLFAYLLMAAGQTWRLPDASSPEAPVRAVTLCSLLILLVVSNAGFPWHLASTTALFALNLAILASTDHALGNDAGFFASGMPWRAAAARPVLALLWCGVGLAAYIVQQAALVEYKLMHSVDMMNVLIKFPDGDAVKRADLKAQMLKSMREGIAINPHYRRITAELAEPLAAGEDWTNAVWVLESLVASRPHIAAMWTGLAMGYSRLGQHDRAQAALQQVQRLKPDAASTRTLEVILLNRAGHPSEAVSTLMAYLDQGPIDFDMVQVGYALGYKTHSWPLAIRALQVRIATWPEQAGESYFLLGKLYAEPAAKDDPKALAAFQAGLDALPAAGKENYRKQIPLPYQGQLK